MTAPTLDDWFADAIFTELVTLEIHLDSDPLTFGPKRLNAKVAAARRMLSRTERIFLDVSQRLHQFTRAHRMAATDLELGKKDLFANDPETRAGHNIADRDAIASMKLRQEVQATADLDVGVKDLEAILIVVKAKRSDLRDTQGRLRDQIRLCQEEIGLGGRWGSKSPRGVELEPGQGFADGSDADDIDKLIEGVIDAETHVRAEIDASDDESEKAAILASADAPEPECDAGAETLPHADMLDSTRDAKPPSSGHKRGDIIPGEDLVEEFGFLPHCEECGEPQHQVVGSGICCPNGHGGCNSIPKPDVKLDTDEPPAVEVLPGTTSAGDVDSFLADVDDGPPSDQVTSKKRLSRRQIEEDDELDLESLLATFE